MKIIRIFILLLHLIVSGCVQDKLTGLDIDFERTGFATDVRFEEVVITEDCSAGKTECIRMIRIRGASSEQIQAIRAASEGAARGAVEGIK